MRLILILALGLMSCQTMLAAEPIKPKEGAVPVAYDANGNPIYKLIDLEERIDTTIYSGTKSVDGEFPELGFLGFCTATAVGPNVIYTAAHCVSDGQRVNWKMRKDNVAYAGTCNKHPEYNDRTVFNDYAFCILDKKLPADTVFASFNIKGSPSVGAQMLLNGYGAPNLGTHYWGKASVKSNGSQDIVTCGPSNLGGGDSGGPFFKWSENRKNPGVHIIDGTNSRAGGGCSYFNSTSHPNFKPYAESVAAKAGTYICGVTKDCGNGGGDDNEPGKCEDEKRYVAYITKQLIFANEAVRMCLASSPKP
jgi:hypothetical protein